MRSIAGRFWEKVDKGEPNGCWLWLGTKWRKDYGGFRLSNSPNRGAQAHRVAYELMIGPIPDGLTIDHLCRNHACVNPAHMEVVSNRVNILRGEGRAAQQHRQTHCIRGHSFDLLNTYYYPSGRRECRECHRQRGRKRCENA